MNIFVAVLLVCTSPVCDPSNVRALSSAGTFPSKEVCEANIQDVGIPFVEERGGIVISSTCVSFTSEESS